MLAPLPHNRPLALICTPASVGAAEGAAAACETVHWDELVGEDTLARLEILRQVQALICVGGVKRPVSLDDLPMLRIVSFFGAGYDEALVDQCFERGIATSYGPGSNSEDVADLAVGLLISVARQIGEGDRLIRAGNWLGLTPLPLVPSIRSLRCGIVGFGSIGSAVAERLRGFGSTLAWWGPGPKTASDIPRAASLLDLAAASDVLIVTARGGADTHHLIDSAIFDALGNGYIINVSRGSLVDEAALLARLGDGRLAGAGLDVFATEPTDPAKWAGLTNVVLTPHIGGRAAGSISRAQAMLGENLRRQFANLALLTPVPRSQSPQKA